MRSQKGHVQLHKGNKTRTTKAYYVTPIGAVIEGFDREIRSTCRTRTFFPQKGGRYNARKKKKLTVLKTKHTLQL